MNFRAHKDVLVRFDVTQTKVTLLFIRLLVWLFLWRHYVQLRTSTINMANKSQLSLSAWVEAAGRLTVHRALHRVK